MSGRPCEEVFWLPSLEDRYNDRVQEPKELPRRYDASAYLRELFEQLPRAFICDFLLVHITTIVTSSQIAIIPLLCLSFSIATMNSAPGIQGNSTPPSDDDFTPLQEHQEMTPSTFFGGKPVLYSHQGGLAFSAPKDKLKSHPNFGNLHTETEGADEGDVLVRDVEVWVNSKYAVSSPRLSILTTNPNV